MSNDSNQIELTAEYKLHLALDIMTDRQVEEWEEQAVACEELMQAEVSNPTGQSMEDLFQKFISSLPLIS